MTGCNSNPVPNSHWNLPCLTAKNRHAKWILSYPRFRVVSCRFHRSYLLPPTHSYYPFSDGLIRSFLVCRVGMSTDIGWRILYCSFVPVRAPVPVIVFRYFNNTSVVQFSLFRFMVVIIRRYKKQRISSFFVLPKLGINNKKLVF